MVAVYVTAAYWTQRTTSVVRDVDAPILFPFVRGIFCIADCLISKNGYSYNE